MRHLYRLALVAAMAFASPACGYDIRSADSGSDTDTDSDSGTDAGVDAGIDTDTDTGSGDTAVWVTAGYMHSCAVIDGGYVKCWGDQQWGELGYGDDLGDLPGAITSLPSTLPFVDVGSAVAKIEGGINHTCSLLANGTAKCWGADGDVGVLGVEMGGSDTIGKYDVPADHAPIDFGVAVLGIDTGSTQSCVVLDGGDVVCWGDDEDGELGYGGVPGYNMSDPAASTAVDLGGPAVQVSTGLNHTCAVLENGDVLCWGQSGSGELGYGNQETVGDDEVPADVGPVELGGPAVQVSAGYYHTCALLESGEVLCWGLGDEGQFGYGNTDTIGDDEVPASVGPVDIGGVVTQVSCGSKFTCALLETGDMKCWGVGSPALGYGNTETIGDDELPAEVGVVDVGGVVAQIDTGMAHTCALLEAGEILCWGDASDGRLGYGYGEDIGDDETPVEVGPIQLF